MAAIEAVLAGFGLLALIFMVYALVVTDPPTPARTEDDPALPYREALAASMRIQQAAEEAQSDLTNAAAAGRARQKS